METDKLSGDFFMATFSEAVPKGLRLPSSPIVPTAAVNVLSSEFSPSIVPSTVMSLFCEGPISPNVQTLSPLLGLGSEPLNRTPGGYFISIFKFLAADSELEMTAILMEIFWPETAFLGAAKDKPKGALEILTE